MNEKRDSVQVFQKPWERARKPRIRGAVLLSPLVDKSLMRSPEDGNMASIYRCKYLKYHTFIWHLPHKSPHVDFDISLF